jgi:hypothetical protein
MLNTHVYLAAKLRMSGVIPPPTSRHLVDGDSFKFAFIRLLGAGHFQLSLGLNNSKFTWNFSDEIRVVCSSICKSQFD